MKEKGIKVSEISINNITFDIIFIKKKYYQKYTYYRFKDNKFYIYSYFKYNEKELDTHIKYIKNLFNKLVKSKRINIENIINSKLKKNNLNSIYVLGKEYKIIDNLDDSNTKYIYIFNKYIDVTNIDSTNIVSLYKILYNDIYSLVYERFIYYEELMNIPLKERYILRFRDMSTLLGSNSRKTHKITLSYSLIPYSLDIISSVIVHELAHYFEFNHSYKFYNIVYKYSPNYDELQNKIKRRIYQ